jgi:hypothetical protein
MPSLPPPLSDSQLCTWWAVPRIRGTGGVYIWAAPHRSGGREWFGFVPPSPRCQGAAPPTPRRSDDDIR